MYKCTLEFACAHPRTEEKGETGVRWQRSSADPIRQYYHKYDQ